MPAHEWNGSQLRFRDAVDSWGDYVDLRGPQGPAGAQGPAGVGTNIIRRSIIDLADGAFTEIDTGAGVTPISVQAWFRDGDSWFDVRSPTGNNVATCGACGDGSDGVYAPTVDAVLNGGQYDFESFSIPNGVTVTVQGGSPLDVRSQKPVKIAGRLVVTPGRAGGHSGGTWRGTSGSGPGGGQGAGGRTQSGAGGGFGTRGQNGANTTGGSTYGGQLLTELLGGSGGGGSENNSRAGFTAAEGGKGGGAVRIVGPTISVTGSITALGEQGGRGNGGGGGGSGGSIWLRGESVNLNNNSLSVAGGAGGSAFTQGGLRGRPGGQGGFGRIRIDTSALTGEVSPSPERGTADRLAIVPSSKIRVYQVTQGVVRIENYAGSPRTIRVVIVGADP
jgi:hypothetical protein